MATWFLIMNHDLLTCWLAPHVKMTEKCGRAKGRAHACAGAHAGTGIYQSLISARFWSVALSARLWVVYLRRMKPFRTHFGKPPPKNAEEEQESVSHQAGTPQRAPPPPPSQQAAQAASGSGRRPNILRKPTLSWRPAAPSVPTLSTSTTTAAGAQAVS